MGKLLRVVLAIALGLWAMPVFAEPVQQDEAVPISVVIGTVSELTVVSRNITNNAAAALSFSAAGVTTAAPWRTSDQYLDIEYNCNVASWGVRLITDNTNVDPAVNPLAGIAGFVGVVGDKIGSGEAVPPDDWDDGDEILSFAGLINTGEVTKSLDPLAPNPQNPKMRASLGWQVLADRTVDAGGVGIKPANPTDANYGGNPYSSAWAYLGDKGNYVTNADGKTLKMVGGVPAELGDEPIITGTTAGGDLIFNYALIAYGGVGQSLAQHPEVLPSKPANDSDVDGKLDVAVYVAARFANTDYSGPAPVDFVLPGGTYQTQIWVELIHN